MSDNEDDNLPTSIEELEDLCAMFKTAVPVQIVITEPIDLIAVLHAILRMMCHGNVIMANSFLKAASDTAKILGVDKAVEQGVEVLTNAAGTKPPTCLGPLLTHMLNHSLDPTNRKAFDAYLRAKKKQDGKGGSDDSQ